MSICTIPNCGKKLLARGYCSAHYAKWSKYGNPCKNIRENTIEDFWNNVDKTRDCWLWLLSKDKDGYGFFWYKNKQVKAHRFIVEYTLKLDLTNLQVCHICDNPSCVRLEHLFVGTVQDNKDDCITKGRQAKGEKIHTSKLTEEDIIGIRQRLEKGEERKKLQIEFGVSKSTIQFIEQRRTWKHIL